MDNYMDMNSRVHHYEEIDSVCTSRRGQTEVSKRIPSPYLKPLVSTNTTTTSGVKATFVESPSQKELLPAWVKAALKHIQSQESALVA